MAFNGATTTLAEMPERAEPVNVFFGADGNQVAAIIKQDNSEYIAINGVAGRAYDKVKSPVFRKGFAGYAYEARKNNRACVVLDGKELKWYDTVDRLFFTSGGHLLYAARQGNKWRMISEKGDKIISGAVPFPLKESTDGKRVVFFEVQDGTNKSIVNVCDQEISSCKKSSAYDLSESVKYDAGVSHLAFVSKGPEKSIVVVLELAPSGIREVTNAAFDAVLVYNISENGSHVAVLGRRGTGYVLWKDGEERSLPSIEAAFDLIVTDDGGVFYSTYAGNQVKAFFSGAQMGREYSSVSYPIPGPKGKGVVFVGGRTGKSLLVIDGHEGPVYEKIVAPHIAPNGNFIAFRARNKGERFVVVADSKGNVIKEHPHYEAVWDVSFTPDGKSVAYGVKDGNKLIWKAEKLEK